MDYHFLDALAFLETTQVGESVSDSFSKVTILAHIRGFELVFVYLCFYFVPVSAFCIQFCIRYFNVVLLKHFCTLNFPVLYLFFVKQT